MYGLKASTLHSPKIKGLALNTVGYTRIINMIFHTRADLPIFISSCTSWMIPESIETNKKKTIFKKRKKKKEV